MGFERGTYRLGDVDVEIQENPTRAVVRGSKTLAGSVARMDDSVKNFRNFAGCSLVEAVEAATLKPAQVLGIDNKKGSLEVGHDADFLVVDDELNIRACIISGQICWTTGVLKRIKNGFRNPYSL